MAVEVLKAVEVCQKAVASLEPLSYLGPTILSLLPPATQDRLAVVPQRGFTIGAAGELAGASATLRGQGAVIGAIRNMIVSKISNRARNFIAVFYSSLLSRRGEVGRPFLQRSNLAVCGHRRCVPIIEHGCGGVHCFNWS